MAVEISEDKLKARITALSFGGEKITAKEFVAAVQEQYQISHGLIKEGLQEAFDKAKAEDVVRGNFTVAEGSPPEPGEDGKVVLKFLGEAEESTALPYRELRTALGKEELDEVLEPELIAALVTPGEGLAVIKPPGEGKPGKDVHGNEIIQPGKEAQLKAGANVEKIDNGCISQVYGYVCLIDDEISVLPPIWVSADWQEAHFVHFAMARAAQPPQSGWLLQSLQLKGVTSGIDEVAVETLSTELPAATEKGSVVVAKGKPAVPGQDSHVKYAVDLETRAGKILPDGTIDYRDRNSVVGVAPDELLGEVLPATMGGPGVTLKGEEVPATDGEEKAYTAGQNVRSQTEGDTVKFFSEIDGAVNVTGETIEVQPIYNIGRDVDYETGNIDLPANVDIKGCVRAGFSVTCGGTVTVGDVVENGATIHARGDVVVAKGIFGEDTNVVAQGNVETKFIQGSTVMAHGDVTVGAFVFNGIVRAGGSVRVEEGGGGRAGSLVGGEIVASKGIQAKFIGSADTDRTIVAIGPTPEQLEQRRKLSQTIGQCDSQILPIVRRLGLSQPTVEEVDRWLKQISPRQREKGEELAEKLKELIAEKDGAAREQEELDNQIADTIGKGTVGASDTVFTDVHIQFGEKTNRVGADTQGAEFYVGSDGIRWRPLETEAGTEADGGSDNE